MNYITLTALSFFIWFYTPMSQAATDVDLSELSLEDLMDVKVKVATESDKPIREAAGIITVITEKEIKSVGARDLKDILQTVPGITFGQDVLGNVSIIMRGLWAQEGRILLLIDGMEMNERSYGTLLLSNHYPADQIKRIEIIRGPGSSIYGGFAELGVINITTKDGTDIKGADFSSSYARTSKEFSQTISNFMFGHTEGNLNASVKGSFNNSNFSDRNYTDENGTTANLGKGNSQICGEFLNLRVKYKALYINYIKDNHRSSNIILWGDLESVPGSGNIRKPLSKEYLTDVYQVGYEDSITQDFNLHLYYQNKVQRPYFQPNTQKDSINSWRRIVERSVYGVKTQYKFNKHLNINTGGEFSEDSSISLTSSGFGLENSNRARISNKAIFSQIDISSDIVNITAGVRYDNPDKYDPTVVPRFGITKVMGPSHIKALFSQAFRAPVIENISLNRDIKPELTTTSEIEFGHQFNRMFTWNLNLFSTQVKNAIVYSYDSGTATENYNNYNYVKLLGAETEINLKHGIHDTKFNYSTYKVNSLDAVAYETSKDNSALVGAPRHKLFFKDTLSLAENFEVTPSFTMLLGTNGYAWDGTQFSETRLKDQFIANIFGNYKNIFTKGFEVGAGINNIFDHNVYYAQPYVKPGDYRAGAYPGQSREYVLRLGYSKEF